VVKQRLSRDDDLDQHAKDQVKTNREDLSRCQKQSVVDQLYHM
jgi:hypothetical protein